MIRLAHINTEPDHSIIPKPAGPQIRARYANAAKVTSLLKASAPTSDTKFLIKERVKCRTRAKNSRRRGMASLVYGSFRICLAVKRISPSDSGGVQDLRLDFALPARYPINSPHDQPHSSRNAAGMVEVNDRKVCR